ncbi:MAG: Gfo/Idh/MocA family oxidoreductase [Candidatus Latescibacteria bacterium]|nr:Gfo/Idh/MocA family oxidoreductase [Candidatus Latescibacterota bacterium]
MRIGWGIVGCGDIANKRVAPAINEQADSDLIAFFSHTKARAEEFARQHEARRAYDDLDALLADPEIQAVYVASPQGRHCRETIAAAEAGKHVLCEKPMAMTPDECRRMIDACRVNDVCLSVAYYRRFFPKARKMKALLEEGAIGQVVQGNISMLGLWNLKRDDPKYWRVTKEASSGGALADTGSHRLDLLCYFLGEPESVAGFADRLALDVETPDVETLVVRMKGGAHVVSRHTLCTPTWQDDFELFGTKGALLATPWDGDELTVVVGSQRETLTLPKHPNVHFPLIDDFAGKISRGERPEFDGADGLQASRIIEGCYASARTGQIVRV